MNRRAIVRKREAAKKDIERALNVLFEEKGLEPRGHEVTDVNAVRKHIQGLAELQTIARLLEDLAFEQFVTPEEENPLTVEDLMKVKGVGEATAERILELINGDNG